MEYEFLVISVATLIMTGVLQFVFGYSKKKLKSLGVNKHLDDLAKDYPSNKEMCKAYLQKLDNEGIEIEESKDAKSSLYIVATNKILIANIQDSYTRIQTIAHECLHSVQNRKLLLFNFIYSNVYMLLFIAICILLLLKVLPSKMLVLSVFLIFSLVYYAVRMYLENDAMIKARYLAKEYMEEQKISKPEEINELVKGFDDINKEGIAWVNFSLFRQIMLQVFAISIL